MQAVPPPAVRMGPPPAAPSRVAGRRPGWRCSRAGSLAAVPRSSAHAPKLPAYPWTPVRTTTHYDPTEQWSTGPATTPVCPCSCCLSSLSLLLISGSALSAIEVSAASCFCCALSISLD
ncbi:hypothetical protein BS78_10G203300 [Paspalum vaginatum]|nr:hypothetical protein BS78_10G203300 [Paspalum vaginatum]KAJ1260067.1 hypothetical protein BS78_10G203300 [Paspalum vaginatum]